MMTQGKSCLLNNEAFRTDVSLGVISSYCDCTILGQGRCLVIVTMRSFDLDAEFGLVDI